MFDAKTVLRGWQYWLLGIVVAVLLFAVSATKAAGQEKPTPRTDFFGDPLPEGAIARLGTLRWRHGSNVTFLAYVNGGKEILTSSGDGVARVWNVETGQEVRRIGSTPKNDPNELVNPGIAFNAYQGGLMNQLAVSQDGKMLATAGADGKVHVWDIASAKELSSFAHGHPQMAGGLVFTPDGKSLITRGAQDAKIKVWDPIAGKLGREFGEQNRQGRNIYYGGMPYPITVSPDGKYLAGAAMDFDNRAWANVMHVWDLAEGKEVKSFKDPAGGPGGISPGACPPTFSPDSKTVAWPMGNGVIQLFDVATGKELVKMGDEKAEFRPTRTAFTADGKKLAALTTDQTIILHDVATGKQLKVIGEEAGTSQVKGVPRAMRANFFNYGVGIPLALSPDGKTIAQGWGNLVRIWNIETGKGNDLSGGHRGEIQGVFVAADGKTAVTAGVDGTARRWDAAGSKELNKVDLPPDTVSTLLITPTRGVLRDQEGIVRLWDVVAGKELLKIEGPAGNSPNVMVASSIDGKVLVVSTADQTLRICSLETGKELNTIKDLQAGGAFPGGGRQYLYALDITPDGAAVAVQYWTNELVALPGGGIRNDLKHTIRMYDALTGKTLWESPVANLQCRWFCFSSDGHNLVIVNADGTSTMLLDSATGKERCRFSVSGNAVAFSDDGHFMAIGSPQGPAKVFDVRAVKEIASLDGHQGHVSALAFSPDAGSLFAGGADGTTLVWDIREQVKKARQIAELDAEKVKTSWNDLGDADAAKAYRAVTALAASPKQSLTLLSAQLKPAKGFDPARIEKYIVDLDNDDFEVRQKAFQELSRIGTQAGPAMKKALEGEPSVEVRRQLEQLLERTTPGQAPTTAESLREVRAIEVLELIGNAEAKTVLEALAKGAAGTRMTLEAAAAMKRLSR
jgi:WD40 repeat protein